MTSFLSGQRRTVPGPVEWFTGTVFIDEIAQTMPPSQLRVHSVTFTPGARTAWHTHPLGQVLHATAGLGRVQIESSPIRELNPGDTIVIAPGQRHWHGAAPEHTFVHLAVQEADPATGEEATWYDHVTDAQYLQVPT